MTSILTSSKVLLAFTVFILSEFHLGLGNKAKSDPCENHNCGQGRECYVTPEKPLRPQCRPSCEVIRCAGDHICQDGKCIPRPTYIDRCASILCLTGTYCVNGECIKEPTCEGIQCPPGEKCYLDPIACFVAPCPSVTPNCRPDLCATVRCASGFTCKDGQCVVNGGK